ncbi:MAG: cation transporter [Gammaproteobacteria bacterium]|nr:MAG: cation transporter [Gammaproteobacteria bacterium]
MPQVIEQRQHGSERYRDTRFVTWVGAFVDLVLAAVKIAVGLVARSEALVADGLHSLSDLLTDFMVLYAARHSHRAADEEHPYGHGRIETAMTVALGSALFLVAGGIAYDALDRLFFTGSLVRPGAAALLAAAFSVVAKEALFRYTRAHARRHRSPMLEANAWHHRSDAVSSLIVIVGVGGALAGYPWLDAVAAVAVAVLIARIAWDLIHQSVRELIDTALEKEEVERIRHTIREVEGVESLHMLRTRRSGGDALVDVHIQVDPRISVSEGHQIGEAVRRKLLEDLDFVTDVTVHIDPENDETASPNDGLPLRSALMARLRQAWTQVTGRPDLVRDVVLHYLDGRIHVDLILDPRAIHCGDPDVETLGKRLREAIGALPDIGRIRVLIEA